MSGEDIRMHLRTNYTPDEWLLIATNPMEAYAVSEECTAWYGYHGHFVEFQVRATELLQTFKKAIEVTH